MEREEILERLKVIRKQLKQIREKTEYPAIERSMFYADMYCHFAQWQLGDAEAIIPEVEQEEK